VVDSKGKIANEQELYPTESHFTLYVSGGQSLEDIYLPDVERLTLDQAKQVLMTYSLNLGALIYSAEVQDSNNVFVYRQYPAFEVDVKVPAGSSVDLWLTTDSTKLSPVIYDGLDTTNL
jgi:beta-lactam-binding protein with PASTA domain